jgi:hypothetical protein
MRSRIGREGPLRAVLFRVVPGVALGSAFLPQQAAAGTLTVGKAAATADPLIPVNVGF